MDHDEQPRYKNNNRKPTVQDPCGSSNLVWIPWCGSLIEMNNLSSYYNYHPPMAYDIDTIYPLPKVPLAPLIVVVIYKELTDISKGGKECRTRRSSEEGTSNWRAQRVASKKIPKPHGQVGCLGRGGYTLASELKWDNADYKSVQVSHHLLPSNYGIMNAYCKQKFVQDCLKDYICRGHLRAGYPISMQPKEVVCQVQQEVCCINHIPCHAIPYRLLG